MKASKVDSARHRVHEKVTAQGDDLSRDDNLEHGRFISSDENPGEQLKPAACPSVNRTSQPNHSPVSPGQHHRQAKQNAGILARAWQDYCMGLETHPLLVKSLTSFVGFFIADHAAQLLTGVYLDHKRLARMLLFALTVHGPMCHFWYKGLDQIVLPDAPKSVAAITLKIVLDQLLFAPLFLIVFWYVLKLLEGRPEEAYGMCAEKLYPTLLVSYMVWPAAHAINFKYIPSSQRLLYINVITVFWTTYISWSAGSSGRPEVEAVI